jgi:hypothetical protein
LDWLASQHASGYNTRGQFVNDRMKHLPHVLSFPPTSAEDEWWKDQIICGDSRAVLHALPNECIHLAITSPPYNVGLDYDGHNDRMSYDRVSRLAPAGLARTPPRPRPGRPICPQHRADQHQGFRPIHYDMARNSATWAFIMRTEILWYKQTMRRRTAWGSWKSPRNPHILPSWEYVLVFSKGSWTLEGDKKLADIAGQEFIKFSDGFWPINAGNEGPSAVFEKSVSTRAERKLPNRSQTAIPLRSRKS